MSQENVRIVEAAYEALSSSGIDAFSDYWDDDIEWQTMRERWRGRRAGRAYLQEYVDLFDDFRTEPLELVDAGAERVVIYLRYSGWAKRAGMEVPPEYFAIVIDIHEGKLVRAVEYATRREALEAAGLSE
jgi:ketosteroid isomerase-like protein